MRIYLEGGCPCRQLTRHVSIRGGGLFPCFSLTLMPPGQLRLFLRKWHLHPFYAAFLQPPTPPFPDVPPLSLSRYCAGVRPLAAPSSNRAVAKWRREGDDWCDGDAENLAMGLRVGRGWDSDVRRTHTRHLQDDKNPVRNYLQFNDGGPIN